LASSLAQAAPRARDVWHLFIADGERYGYVHTAVVRLSDGNFRITRETRLLVDVLGINKEFTVIADEPNPVKGLAGHRLEFRSVSGEGKARHGFEVLWRKPGSGYLLTLNAEEPAYVEARKRFDALLATFEDLEPLHR
jgi:hypothetical protein